jgi:hypothetical protein
MTATSDIDMLVTTALAAVSMFLVLLITILPL